METLREAWNASAGEWIAWARSQERDHEFWRMNLPALLALLPPPRGATLHLRAVRADPPAQATRGITSAAISAM